MNTSTLRSAYEVRNPSFSDMTLEQQIEVGINDWCAESRTGHPYYGKTKEAAEDLRARLCGFSKFR